MIDVRSVFSFAFLSFGLANPATAQRVAVLVPGYMSDGSSWHDAGILPQLQQTGWNSAGHWLSTRSGVKLASTARTRSTGKDVYTVTLPSAAPLATQARFLGGILQAVNKRNPEAAIDLVGHSAGGVVARLTLVNYGAGAVRRLITIASPHLGTERAWQAMDATDDRGLFGTVKRWFVKRKVGDEVYQSVQRSRGALADLAPPVPGTLLNWLNVQVHPDIEYVSVVRSAAFGFAGDQVVPAPSQDMNRVAALAGRSQLHVVARGHPLSVQDGRLLAELLAEPTPATDDTSPSANGDSSRSHVQP